MRDRLRFILTAFACALILLAFKNNRDSQKQTAKKKIVSCSPDWATIESLIEENDIPYLPEAGPYTWKITTKSDSAQLYFNQGINMYYAFHIIESLASFKKAAKFDPDAPMLYWAQALAYGPNINDIGYAASPEALEACRKAKDLMMNSSTKERLLITAQEVRYSADSTVSREVLNQAYVDEMKKAYEQFPEDADVAALYADALMLQHPWDLWSIDGKPKPWTPAIREILEKLLSHTPNHPGANHYYIHVMEASPFYKLALPSADRLGDLTPGLSHTVHMPSHIYLRSGNYLKGSDVNERAVNAYNKLIPIYSPVTGNAFLYVIHNLHMQTNNALLAGRYEYSKWSARETVKSIPVEYLDLEGPMANYIQNIYSMPLQVEVKFGKWDAILEAEKPESRHLFSNVIYHFARGMAYAGKKNFPAARQELKAMEEIMRESALHVPMTPFSAAIESAEVGRAILRGSIALNEGNHAEAIHSFQQAVIDEEKIVYNEPRDWILNPGQYLGNVYMQAGQYDNARQAFEKDLSRNNENPWSLYGLWQAHKAQNHSKEALDAITRFNKAKEKSDIEYAGAAY